MISYILSFIQRNTEEKILIYKYILPLGTLIITAFILYRLYLVFHFYYASKFKKPLFNHVYIKINRLSPEQRSILKNEFSFYKKLTLKEQKYFEHRVTKFIESHEFVGKNDLIVTERMKVIIASTASMLTFGFNNYRISVLNKILLYPEPFYSKLNKAMHKGEFNPAFNAIVFSWIDVELGYSIDNDNFNLAIHEFVHAIHFDSLRQRDTRSAIFINSFSDIAHFLENNENYRKRLIESKYFRDYAYTNQYEFLSVLIESFLETPNEFKEHFPEIYVKTKQMLNFKFAGY
jgi:Mlc titration factor MtfA (ptsG expression regulator)